MSGYWLGKTSGNTFERVVGRTIGELTAAHHNPPLLEEQYKDIIKGLEQDRDDARRQARQAEEARQVLFEETTKNPQSRYWMNRDTEKIADLTRDRTRLTREVKDLTSRLAESTKERMRIAQIATKDADYQKAQARIRELQDAQGKDRFAIQFFRAEVQQLRDYIDRHAANPELEKTANGLAFDLQAEKQKNADLTLVNNKLVEDFRMVTKDLEKAVDGNTHLNEINIQLVRTNAKLADDNKRLNEVITKMADLASFLKAGGKA